MYMLQGVIYGVSDLRLRLVGKSELFSRAGFCLSIKIAQPTRGRPLIGYMRRGYAVAVHRMVFLFRARSAPQSIWFAFQEEIICKGLYR